MELPVHPLFRQVLDSFEAAISRLYVAGSFELSTPLKRHTMYVSLSEGKATVQACWQAA